MNTRVGAAEFVRTPGGDGAVTQFVESAGALSCHWPGPSNPENNFKALTSKNQGGNPASAPSGLCEASQHSPRTEALKVSGTWTGVLPSSGGWGWGSSSSSNSFPPSSSHLNMLVS